MGSAKRYMELTEDRGWRDLATNICSDCVVDKALVAAIRAHGGNVQCAYCEETPKAPGASAPIELVLELVVDGLKLEFEDPVEGMAWDGGYVGDVQDTWDLLWDLGITDREKVHNDLHSAIVNDQWCQRNPYATPPGQAMTSGWEAFRRFVKHERRFTFLTMDHSTAEGAGMIPMHAMPSTIADAVAEAGLVIDLPVGSDYWRVRPHPHTESFSSAAALGTPPDSIARDNRMTPKGIGAFYGASTAAGAIAEVAGYADRTHDGSIGKFMTIAPLTVVDLRDLPEYPSLFDADRRHLRAALEFLNSFVKDATEVADPTDKQNLEYIPTQVIAETFRYDLPADGVMWRSSKDPSVVTCVLFIPATEVAEVGSESSSTRLVLDPSSVDHVDAPF